VSDEQQPNRYADMEAIRALDFDVEAPRCIGPDCNRLATWSLTFLCPSRHGSLMCGPHHEAWVRQVKRIPNLQAVCMSCPDKPTLPAPFFSWSRL
jgi:hypothetical protein